MAFFGRGRGEPGARPEVTKETGEKKTFRAPTRLELLAAAGGAMALGAVGAEFARAEKADTTPSPETSQVIDKYTSYADGGSYDADFKFPFATWNADKGTVEVNPLRILEPAYIGVSRKSGEATEIHFTIPQILMEANPKNEADYVEMNEKIQKEIRDQLASRLVGFSWDKNDWEKANGSVEGRFTVESLTVTGTASPEWVGGSKTIEPGNIEPGNVELAQSRAADATTRLQDVLQDMGFDITESLEEINAEEIQFDPEEMAQLEGLARLTDETGSASDAIYKMITKYNLGKLNNPQAEAILDQIVASKRTIQVEIKLKDNKADTVLVPLPFLLLLGAIPLLRRRRKGSDKEEEGVGASEEKKSEEGKEKIPDQVTDVKDGVWRPQITNMPSAPELSKEELLAIEQAEHAGNLLDMRPKEMRSSFAEDVMIDISRDFSYYEYVARWHATEEEPDVNEMTHEILALWEKSDGKETGAYGKNPEQVTYANLHANALVEVIKGSREKNVPMSEAWRDPEINKAARASVQKEGDRVEGVTYIIDAA